MTLFPARRGPSDPRAALRWSLTKLRAALSDETSSALTVEDDSVVLDRRRTSVDVHEIRRALDARDPAPSRQELESFDTRLAAGYLVGLEELDGVEFQLWLEWSATLSGSCTAA